MHSLHLTTATIALGTAAALNIPAAAPGVPAPEDQNAAATIGRPDAGGSVMTARPRPADPDYDAYVAFRKAELSRQRQSQASYFADRDELAMRQQKQRELNKVLPADTEAATFLSALQAVSNISGIDLKGWSPQEEVAQTFFAKVPMRLTITGRFHQIAKFIYEVGKQDRIINMENLELSAARVKELGFEGVIGPVKLSCSNHEGTSAARVQTWVERTRTEMDRVGAEVADLQVCTRKARELSDRAAADTIAAARTGTPG